MNRRSPTLPDPEPKSWAELSQEPEPKSWTELSQEPEPKSWTELSQEPESQLDRTLPRANPSSWEQPLRTEQELPSRVCSSPEIRNEIK
jgi:hypothetical protein